MRFRRLHSWDISVQEAENVQRELSKLVSLVDGFSDIRLIAGADVSASAGSPEGHAAVAVLSFDDLELVEFRCASKELTWPYVPGFLSFRETPVILAALEQVQSNVDIVIVDGQGIAHPRRFGIASHLGILLDMPTIGCAKSVLYGTYSEPGPNKGDVSKLVDSNGVQIGNVVRTRAGVRPVFISPGHKVSFESAVKIVLDSTRDYRLPEPIRMAHRLAGKCR
jgi:deoxyribonuclease V